MPDDPDRFPSDEEILSNVLPVEAGVDPLASDEAACRRARDALWRAHEELMALAIDAAFAGPWHGRDVHTQPVSKTTLRQTNRLEVLVLLEACDALEQSLHRLTRPGPGLTPSGR
ncbi:MAG: hypothetical protein IAE78_04650 [Myxococcus sp.]|nr:hypothetical protein [Myxococcus sp.]